MRLGSSRAHGRAAVFAVLTPLLFPAAASAHGLTGRADLPIPIWLFSWGAAAALALSFAALGMLWSTPRLEGDAFRPLSAPLGRFLSSRALDITCGLIGTAMLLLAIVAGLIGAQVTPQNITPTFVYVTFWLGFVPVCVLFGDVFRAFNPWRAVGRFTGWLLRGVEAEPLEYPAWLGRWPAAAGLLAFAALELVSAYGDRPSTVAYAIIVYSSLTWVGMALYGVETWTNRAEGFGVYFNLFSRLSVLEIRGRVLGVRPFLSGLARLELLPGTAAVVMVMIGSVTFDGLSAGPTWLSKTTPFINDVADLGLGPRFAVELVYAVGLLLVVLIVAGFYTLAIRGAHTVDRRLGVRELARKFAPSLVPIALAYAAAHYVSLLLFTGQNIYGLASDPFGRGWDLFGTADYETSFFISAEVFWYLQLFFVVGGHVSALVLAHDRALVLYSDRRAATRSQYWMLAIMVLFTVLALWLLSEAAKG
jgi:hypothetical protein